MQGSSLRSFTAVRDAAHGLQHANSLSVPKNAPLHPLKCIDCAIYSVNYDAGFFHNCWKKLLEFHSK